MDNQSAAFGKLNQSQTCALNAANKYTVVKVLFQESNKVFDYVSFDFNLSIGDFVYVRPASHQPAVAVVQSLEGDESNWQGGRYILGKIDMSAWYEASHRADEFLRLKRKLEEEVAKVHQLQVYELMAKDNPQLREDLDKYKALLGLGREEDKDNG